MGRSAKVEREEIELPENEIFYFANGRVEGVTSYYLINNWTVGDSTYRRWGNRYFLSCFDEHHAIAFDDKEIKYSDLPETVRVIFEAQSRQSVGRLKREGKLKSYRDKN